MKYIKFFIAILSFSFLATGCTDEVLVENQQQPGEEFNIREYSEGYSIAFDITLDRLGGNNTRVNRDDINDLLLDEWENYMNPEEFRILFFDADDNYLFESTSRWFTQVASQDGGNRWRIGVPIFQYLSDGYDDTGENNGKPLTDDYKYNWDKIVEIMRTKDFKVAVLANRPSKVDVPDITDFQGPRPENFGENGPFWTALNSVATEDRKGEPIKKVFDLHHCQFDPIYQSKSTGNGDCYAFIMEDVDGLPYMGAVSSWLHATKLRKVPKPGTTEDKDKEEKRYYRLPVEPQETANQTGSTAAPIQGQKIEDPQYIPMYGIQLFSALSSWSKGTTFNLSEQTASQTGDYDYKAIKMLRSVVKIELRIPMYDKQGNAVEVDNEWAQIWSNNYMARCEPMDVSTPTDQIWNSDHENNCEWLKIKNYGPFHDNGKSTSDFRQRLSWFYGSWDKDGHWDFTAHGFNSNNIPAPLKNKDTDEKADYPRIFNPITQRLKSAFITDTYLPVKDKYHRWVIYCGERNNIDHNNLNSTVETNSGMVNYFKVKLKRKINNNDTYVIYNIPITDYSNPDNPVYNYLEQFRSINLTEANSSIQDMNNFISNMTNFGTDIKKLSKTDYDKVTYPLLRNHFYRLEVSFGDTHDINVQIINAEQRTVGGIEFN